MTCPRRARVPCCASPGAAMARAIAAHKIPIVPRISYLLKPLPKWIRDHGPDKHRGLLVVITMCVSENCPEGIAGDRKRQIFFEPTWAVLLRGIYSRQNHFRYGTKIGLALP